MRLISFVRLLIFRLRVCCRCFFSEGSGLTALGLLSMSSILSSNNLFSYRVRLSLSEQANGCFCEKYDDGVLILNSRNTLLYCFLLCTSFQEAWKRGTTIINGRFHRINLFHMSFLVLLCFSERRSLFGVENFLAVTSSISLSEQILFAVLSCHIPLKLPF